MLFVTLLHVVFVTTATRKATREHHLQQWTTRTAVCWTWTTLHLRSEVMEHNITLGLNVLRYLEETCGLSPRRASEFVRPILSSENIKINTCGTGMEGDTFSPLKHFALQQYGPQAFSKTIQ